MGGSSGAASGTAAGGVGTFIPASSPGALASRNVLSRTAQALAAVRAMQNAARGLAWAGPNHLINGVNDVPNGLGVGGLYPDTGLIPDPNNLGSYILSNGTWKGVASLSQAASSSPNPAGDSDPSSPVTVTVTQNAQQAILNWTTFNIGKNTTLNFDQSAGGTDVGNWIAFNKINDPSGVPSQILGSIQAQGQVYVINVNGIIFGGSSQVNTHALVAASLPINDNLVQGGLLNNPDGQFLFSALTIPVLKNGTGTLAFTPSATAGDVPATGVYGDVMVQAGASLTAPATSDNVGGLVALVGPNVTNAGTISTAYGQTILAAGLQVGLAAHNTNDPTLRGLDVYVGSVADPSLPNQTAGTATNAGLDTPNIGVAPASLNNPTTNPANVNALGDIETPYADATITGSDVEQRGVINSLTSVAYNGRVDLLSDYNAISNGLAYNTSTSGKTPLFIFQTNGTGTVALGPGSVTQIQPDMYAQTVVGNLLSAPSLVNIQGQTIHLESDAAGDPGTGAIIYAPDAGVMPTLQELNVTQPNRILPEDNSDVTLSAGVLLNTGNWITSNVAGGIGNANATSTFFNLPPTGSAGQNQLQVSLDPGATIDVSGSQNVPASVAENIVAVQLSGSQLANSPLQRNGPFYRQTVDVDITQIGNFDGQEWAGTPLGDTTGYINLIQRSVGELTTTGGSVAINAGGAVSMGSNSTINVSGGSINYAGGVVATTRVIADGHIMDISQATPDLIYNGIYTGTSTTTDAKWGVSQTYANPLFVGGGQYEQGYTQGGNAGSVTITAPAMTLDGNFFGNTAPGLNQRTPLSQINSTAEFGATTILRTMESVLGVPTTGSLSLFFQSEQAAGTTASAIAPANETNLTFEPGSSQTTIGNSPTPSLVVLSNDLINSVSSNWDGFGSLTVSDPTGNIEVQTDVTAAAGSALTFTGQNITIDPQVSVSVLSGNLSFTVDGLIPSSLGGTNNTTTPSNVPAGLGQFTLGQGASLSTAGLIVDDRATAAAPGSLPLFTNGGNIAVNAYQIDLQSQSTVDVSGGVQMTAANKLIYGSGGALTLNAQEPTARDSGLIPGTTNYGYLVQDATLRGYSGKAGSGGTLSLTAPFIQVGGNQLLNGDTLSSGRTLWLNETDASGNLLQPDFFDQGGFSNFSLSGLGDFALNVSGQIIPFTYMPAVVIAPDTVIAPQVSSLMAATPAGGGLALNSTLLQVGLRTPASLTFNSLGESASFVQSDISNNEGLRGDLVIYPGAIIQTDPLGSITLNQAKSTGDTVTIMGSVQNPNGSITPGAQIIAPGGTISITGAPTPDEGTIPLFAQTAVPTVDLGPGSVLDASGATVLTPNSRGYTTGTVFPGGSISIIGNIVAEAGSSLKVNGASSQLDVLQPLTGATTAQNGNLSGSDYVSVREDSSGGSITLTGNDELFAGATLDGFAGGPAAAGGSLNISSSFYTAGAQLAPTQTTLILTQSGAPFYVAGQSVTLQNGQTVTAGGTSLVVTGPSGSVSGGPLVIGNPVVDSNDNNVSANGYFAADKFNNGGFVSLTLGGTVQFSGPVSLTATNSIAIGGSGVLLADPAVATSSLTLKAPYVALGQTFLAPVAPNEVSPVFTLAGLFAQPSFGQGSLNVEASDLIDVGNLSLLNIGTANLDATFSGATQTTNGAIRGDGALDVAGAITMTAGQIYPPTATTFNITAYDYSTGSGSVTILRGPGLPPLPLSAGGTLNIYATTINQGGVLRAPIGTIDLGKNSNSSPVDPVSGQPWPSTQTLTLSAGSWTSVSAVDPVTGQDLTIPYGILLNGISWIDPTGTDITVAGNGVAGVGLPAKAVNLTATNVNDEPGSTVDLTGGGDLYAYRWVPGLGGSYDILNASYDAKDSLYDVGSGSKNAPSSSTSFAVIPGYSADYAPFAAYNTAIPTGATASNFSNPNPNPNDPTTSIIDAGYTSTGPGLSVGSQVHLNASNGLPAGTYTLLPARYALLPGAFLITPQSSVAVGTGTVSRADGSSLVSGYLSNHLSPTQPLLSSFEVDPQSVVLARAEYDPSTANNFFRQSAQAQQLAIPRLPIDAGQLVFNATQSLNIGGLLNASTPAGGRGSLVDISSPVDILIANQAGIADNPNFSGLVLDPTALSNFGADSLLIGGVRQSTTTGTIVTVATNNLMVDNAGNALTGPDIILAANQSLTLAPGADVEQGTRTLPGPAEALQVGQQQILSNGASFNVASGGSAIGFPQGTPLADSHGNPSNDAVTANVAATVTSADGKTTTSFTAGVSFTVPVGGTVTLNSGGQLTASGSVSFPVFFGDGTLLRVSSDPSASISRPGVANAVSSSPAVNPVAMKIGSGATIGTPGGVGSVTLDSTNATTLASSATLSGSTINLGSGQISLQLTNPGSLQSTNGLVLTSDAVTALQDSASSLSLLSYSSIDIYGSGQIGSSGLANLSLHAGEIRGFNPGSGATFAAQNILLDNSANGTGPGPVSGQGGGTLTFNAGAGTIELGANQLAIDQYNTVNLQADGGVTVQGTGGLATQGALAIATPVISGAPGAKQTITAGTGTAGGSLSIMNPDGAPWNNLGASLSNLGASLTLVGAKNGVTAGNPDGVTVSSNITLRSGTLNVEAMNGNLSVGDTSPSTYTLDVSGTSQSIFGATQYTSGGQITLKSDKGNVNLKANSTVNVSAQPQAGNAGSLTISAPGVSGPGTLINGGTLLGQGGVGGQAGTFALDVGSLSGVGGNLDSLAGILPGDGFTQSVSIRDRTDSVVKLDDTLTAHNVNLSADSGTIDIAGTIDASGTTPVNLQAPPATNGVINWQAQTGGSINLAAFDSVILEPAAVLNASGYCYNDASQGGQISIEAGAYNTGSTVSGSGFVTNPNPNGPVDVNIETGSSIDLAVSNPYTTSDIVAYWTSLTNGGPVGIPTNNTGSLPGGGTLLLSAPQTANGTDVLIDPINGTINGASSIVAEGYKIYTPASGSIDTIDGASGLVFTDAKTFATTHASTIASRLTANWGADNPTLNPACDVLLNIQPGAEIVNPTGNLTLSSTWNLSTFRFGPNVTSTAGSGEPGILTLRAAGDLDFNFTTNAFASLSDGFGPTPTSANGGLWQAPMLPVGSQSWSYNLVAGADLAAVDFSQVKSGAGSVKLGNNTPVPPSASGAAATTTTIEKYYQVIRTGTGNINIFAGQDVQLLDQLAAIYTAGRQAPALNPASQGSFNTPNNSFESSGSITAPNNFANSASYYQPYYSQNGGNVTISAQGNIIHETGSGAQDSSKELPTNWLYRRGYVDPNGQFDLTHDSLNLGSITNKTGNTEIASTTWWVDFSNFFEGVGALGGGNVTLLAGQDVSNVDAVVPTNARVTYQLPNGDTKAADQTLVELGGGDLVVKAGNNINGGVYYVERGSGTLSAGNQVLTNSTRTVGSVASADPINWLPTTLFLGQGSFNVSAGSSVLLGPVANPFLLPQGIDNSYLDKTYFSTYATTDAVDVSSLTGSLTLQDAASGTSGLNGSLINWYAEVLNQNFSGSPATKQPWLGLVESLVNNSYFAAAAALMPGTLQATAFSGNLNLVGNLTLSPSPNGTINFAAAGSINGLQPNDFNLISQSAGKGFIWSASTIDLSDASPGSLPGLYTPLSLTAAAVAATNPSALQRVATQNTYWSTTPSPSSTANVPNGPTALLPSFATFFAESGSFTGSHGSLQTQQILHGTTDLAGTNVLGPLHANDTTGPIQFYAGTGDISGLTLISGKAAQVVAGNNITDIALYIQNDNPSDVSVVDAGRDIVAYDPDSSLRQAGTTTGNGLSSATPEAGDIQINGPGTLEVLAGRNLNLGVGPNNKDGTAVGITSVGNSRNPVLPFVGADVVAGAGIGSFPTSVPQAGLDSGQLNFTAFIDQFLIPNSTYWQYLFPNLQALLPGVNFSAGLPAVWPELTDSEKQLLAPQILDTFYLVLRDAGRSHSVPISPGFGNYNTGFAAIADLFPTTGSWQGDISLTSRDIKTENGGNIDIFAPGGQLTVGLPVGAQATDQGILTGHGGDISIFTNKSVNVGVSRIFTLRGGNVIIWSSTGNIAAGSASKTLQSAPPSNVTINPQSANIEPNEAGLATGGGIGVLEVVAGVPPANVDLIAPGGFIDAGDAGIRASGTVNVSALQVLNSSNIQAGGTVTGARAPPAAPSIGSIASASSTSSASSNAAAEVAKQGHAPVQQEAFPSIITVEVLGYGGGDS